MYENPQTPKGWPMNLERSAQDVVGTAARTVRQLLPFAGGDVGPLPLLSRGSSMFTTPGVGMPASVTTAAADIVSQAAAILDQETAKGIVAAQQAPAAATPRAGVPPGDLVQQLHAVIESVARAWPASSMGFLGPAAPPSPASGAAGPALPELKPPSPLRPGDQATIAMTIRNREDKPATLTPAATPLLGSNGERIVSQLLEFTPAQLRLEPGQQQELRVTITVPARCGSGSFAGLLVVGGVDYLRALITLEVTAQR